MNQEGMENFVEFSNSKDQREHARHLKIEVVRQIIRNNFPYFFSEEVHNSKEENIISDLGYFGTVGQMEAYCKEKNLVFLSNEQLIGAQKEALEAYNTENVQDLTNIDDAKGN